VAFSTVANDTVVTGGTYSNGTAVFRNNTGGTFNVTGFSTGGGVDVVTGGTYTAEQQHLEILLVEHLT
jgi:hypothetical protein